MYLLYVQKLTSRPQRNAFGCVSYAISEVSQDKTQLAFYLMDPLRNLRSFIMRIVTCTSCPLHVPMTLVLCVTQKVYDTADATTLAYPWDDCLSVFDV